jgi:multiple sugar transport system permease protein
VCGTIWSWAFNGDYGVVNYILVSLGIVKQYIPFLGSTSLAMPAVIVARVWREVPLAALILLAGLQSIPTDLYEAAMVDGTNVWQRFRHITVPLIGNQILLVLIFETMWSLRAFDEIYSMTAGGPAGATTVLSWLVYETAFRDFNFGQGAAVAFVLTLITFVVSFVYVKVLYREIQF